MVMTDERTTTTDINGVYKIGRQTFHDLPRFKGFVREDGEPWRSTNDGERFEVHDYVPVKCIVPPADAEETEVEDRRRAAARAMTDFLHPTLGWLRAGSKRPADAPENLGNGSVKYRRDKRPAPLLPETALNVGSEAIGAGAPIDTGRAGRRSRRMEA